MSDLKSELSEAVKNSRHVGGHQLAIVQSLTDNGIDASKYRASRSVDDIMADLDCRIADLVKQADLSKYQTQKVSAPLADIRPLVYLHLITFQPTTFNTQLSPSSSFPNNLRSLN